MTTQELINETLQDFLESSSSTSWQPAQVVRALNEAYAHLYRTILRHDHDGVFFGMEKSGIAYTAGSRYIVLATALGWIPLRIHAVEVLSSSTYAPVKIISRRNEHMLTQRSAAMRAMVTRQHLYLTESGAAPTSAQTLRVFYSPAPILMKSSGSVTQRGGAVVTWDVYEPEFIADQYHSIAAYAAVRMAIGEQMPSADHQARFNQIERDVIGAAIDGIQNQDLDEILITDTEDYEVYD